MSGSFLPEVFVVMYAAACVAFAILIRRAQLMEFNWGALGLNESTGAYRELHEADTLAQSAGKTSINVLNNTTPGFAARLLVLGVGAVAAFAGVTVIPAIFGAMESVTTLNVLFLLVGGLAFGYALARLTLTLLSVGPALAVLAVGASVSGLVVVFIASLLTGHPYPQKTSTFLSESLTGLAAHQTYFLDGPLGTRVGYNACAVVTSLSTVGDMRAVIETCGK